MPSLFPRVAAVSLLAATAVVGNVACFTPTAQADTKLRAADPIQTLVGYRERALDEVRAAAASDNVQLRAHALEAVQFAPDIALPLVTLGLSDDAPVVRFHALYTAGKLEMVGLIGAFSNAYRSDDPAPGRDHVRAAVIYAAQRCGAADDQLMSVMANLLQHPDPQVRANAVMLTGDLGNDTAVPLIRRATIRPAGDMHPGIQWQILKVQAAEALAKLGDPRGLTALHRSAYSTLDEIRIIAVQSLSRLGDEGFWTNMNNFLVENPVEFRLAAAEGLARMGKDRGGLLQVLAQGATHELETVRAQAAFALGPYDHDLGRGYLINLLNDPQPQVRIAAAAAILEATQR